MSNQRPRSEFTDVDSASNPSDYLLMLDAQRAIPFIQQYKQRVRALLDLHPGQTILEAGSGTGEEHRRWRNAWLRAARSWVWI